MRKTLTTFRAGFLIFASIAGMVCSTPALAQPSADEALATIGLSGADRQRILAGEFVTHDVATVSERDLSMGIAFLVKAAPDALARQIEAGQMVKNDPQVKQNGRFSVSGSASDLSGLSIGADSAQQLGSAAAGSKLNFAKGEFSALDAAQGGGSAAIQSQLQQILLARYQSYKARGLDGIATYDRGGSVSDPASDLRKASQAAGGLKIYLPSLQQFLIDYPKGRVDGVDEIFQWLNYDIDGTPTYVLTHGMIVPFGDARVVVQRQFYVSTGYNAEQAVAAFLPVKEGSIVVYTNHTFTDQVAGWGGSAKRSIGRGIMTKKLEEMFEHSRDKAAAQ